MQAIHPSFFCLLAGVFLVLNSCNDKSKDDPNPDEGDYFMEFNVKGKTERLEKEALGTWYFNPTYPDQPGFRASARGGDFWSQGGDTYVEIFLWLQPPQKLEVGKRYTWKEIKQIHPDNTFEFAYITTTPPYQNASYNSYRDEFYTPGLVQDAEVTLTKANDDVLEGTFSGTIRDETTQDATRATCKFKVKWLQ